MPRPPRPEDLYSLRVPVDVRISPDASRVAAVVKEVAPGKDGYRLSIWLVPCDGSAPARRLTLGARRDTSPRWSPDGSTLAFLSDRSASCRPAVPVTSRLARTGTRIIAAPPRCGCCRWQAARRPS